MFCPKGYVPLSVVMRKRPVVASSLARKGNAAIEKRRAETEGLVTHFKRSSLDKLEGQLFLRLKEKLFLASPSGEVLKLDPWPFMRQLVIGAMLRRWAL